MEVSFVILNYKNGRLIKNCLNSLKQCHFNFSYEIIVADNNSHDPYWLKLKETFTDVTFIENPKNGGYGYGNNLAIKQAHGEFIAIINPDIFVLPNSVETMLAFIKQDENIAMVGPKLTNADGTIQRSCGRYPDWRLPFYRRSFLGKTKSGQAWLKNYFYLNEDMNQPRQVDWLFGAFLLFRKTDFDKVGGFDERFFMYIEDIDLCRQINLTGKKIYYLPQATAIHLHQRDSAQWLGLKGLIKKSGRNHLLSWIKYCIKYII